ncbi:peptidylprolyl isomerase [Sphingobacteriaceae bacterium]|nr:peptidylprolyl isomerase [Sphingobacteriaceae bacterium]
MKKLILWISVLSFFSCGVEAQKKGKPTKEDLELLAKQEDGIYAKIETNKGNIYLFLESKKTPMTVANFVGLAEGSIKNKVKPEGQPYYDGMLFHRVMPNFMIQGGCPNGNGSGDPGYEFPDEFDPSLQHTGPGVLSMANHGANTNGSQFFITHVETNYLNNKHTVFGHVILGQDVVNKIEANDVMKSVLILRKGNDAESFDAAKVFEAEKAKAPQKAAARAKADEEARVIANASALKRFETGKTTASGLKYVMEKEGSGLSPKATDEVTVYYRGTFTDGKEFDGNIGKEPATFRLNGVIPGWTEALQLMKPGGKALLYVPYTIGFGENGGGRMPPKTDMIFEIELLKVN